MAKDLAKELGYIYVDTGAMYRSVTLFALRNGLINEEGINTEKLAEKMNDIHITLYSIQRLAGQTPTLMGN